MALIRPGTAGAGSIRNSQAALLWYNIHAIRTD